ncbi:Pycsar system effector family protein [Saccharopolyspora sp. NPDC049426]|uniref:Pycsar system effector family protein n=1 Tax=Saccharopolyspora sp. NPDC049426 TaxID=3155652 RepID=UPI003421584D
MGGAVVDGEERDTGDAALEVLRAELARADVAIARTDTKASVLLAVFGPIVTVGAAAVQRIPLPAAGRMALWGALVLMLLAVLLLLAVVRPQLRGSGFHNSRRMTDEEMTGFVERIIGDPQRWYRQQLLTISRLGATKFRRVRLATALIGAGMITAVLAVASSQW